MTTAAHYFSQAQLISDDGLYCVVHLPARAITVAAGILAELGEAFSSIIVDADEVTLVLDQEAYEEYQGRLRDHRLGDIVYRLITIDIELPLTMVGFLAYITAGLAQASIPIMAYSSFKRDHMLVPHDHYDAAIQVLRQMQTYGN